MADEYYKSFIGSNEWAKIREIKLTEVGNVCEAGDLYGDEWCDDELNVHHLTYDRFGGEELMADLQVLCRAHHDEAHNNQLDIPPRRYNDSRLKEVQKENKKRKYEEWEHLIIKHHTNSR